MDEHGGPEEEEGVPGADGDDAMPVADEIASEEAVEHVWEAVMGSLKCSESTAAAILEKSIGIRASRDDCSFLLETEEVQDALGRDEYVETEKYLREVEVAEKAGVCVAT